jgi:hypothetical protein
VYFIKNSIPKPFQTWTFCMVFNEDFLQEIF